MIFDGMIRNKVEKGCVLGRRLIALFGIDIVIERVSVRDSIDT